MKKFYKNYRSHIWLLVLTLLFSAVFSIWVFYYPTPLVCGLSFFWFGVFLLYAVIKLTPVGVGGKCFSLYNWEWLLCVVLSTALWIFWELHIPDHGKTWVVVVSVLLWYFIVWLLGLFFINTMQELDDVIDDDN